MSSVEQSPDYLPPATTFNPEDAEMTLGGRSRGPFISVGYIAPGHEVLDLGAVVEWPHRRLSMPKSADACSCGWHPGNRDYAFTCRDHIGDMVEARRIHGLETVSA